MGMNQFVEEIQVLGRDLADRVKSLIHEGNVTRIIIKDEKGNTYMEIPVTVAAVGAILVPVLAAVGAIYLVASIVVALVVGLVTGAGVFALLRGGDPTAGQAAGAVMGMLLAMLVMMALMIPVAMAIWFAPALVVLNGRGAVDAMKESFAGCLKNIVPFLLYGVVLFIASIIAAIPLGLGYLVLGPVMAGSIYAAYRDIYFAS